MNNPYEGVQIPAKGEGRLFFWQEKMAEAESFYEEERLKMNRREELYRGDHRLIAMSPEDKLKRKTPHVRNICMELIESQVDSNIPSPKVTPIRPQDEGKARIIEDMLRHELDRLPFEAMNDMLSRTVPIQGGAAFLVEWDNSQKTSTTVGELDVSALHPKQLIPQNGVTTSIEDMDYVILVIPQTKEYIRRRYGKDVSADSEEEPDVRGAGAEDTALEMVTQYIAYYRNDHGGIGLYSWVYNTELEDLDDYQARRQRVCATCGAAEQTGEDLTAVPEEEYGATEMPKETKDGEPVTMESRREGRKICPHCGGSTWKERSEDYEEIYLPIQRGEGLPPIPGASIELEEKQGNDGLPYLETVLKPTKVPYYKPSIYPVILIRNTSMYGNLLGGSDIDAIADQQNTTNRIEAKIIEKMVAGGSYMTLPDDCSIEANGNDMKIIRPRNAADKDMIDVKTMEGVCDQDFTALAQSYEEARQVIGITDAFQGRKDPTATSGKAKEFAAAQSAGRLESKRVMKNAAYADLFKAMFMFKLAYTDEPRPVPSINQNGDREYKIFNRYDFLEQDESGAWWWNDMFLFSTDTSAPLANNREAMWQEARMNLQTGAFGDPTALATLVIFWKRMEELHYPGAGDTRQYLEDRLKQQIQQQIQMQQMQLQMQAEAQRAGAAQAVRDMLSAPAANSGIQYPQRPAETQGSGVQVVE